MFPRTPLAAAAIVALSGIVATSAYAAPVAVNGGAVAWAQANVYSAAGVTPPQRTFLGHTTNPGVPTRGQSNGTVAASAGATVVDPVGASLTEVGPTSARGATSIFGFGFPVGGGSVDAAARQLDVTTSGTVSYAQYPALSPGAPPVLTVVNPRVVINGNVGQVFASGAGAGGVATYDTTTPLFTLDASAATFTTAGSGAVTIDGLVPTLALAGIFGSAGQYAPGVAGPDRSPNTFGGFSVTVTPTPVTPEPTTPAPTTPVTPVVPTPVTPTPTPAAPAAAAPTAPAIVAPTSERWTGAATTSGFKAKRAISVKIRKRGQWAILGEGIIKGQTLTLNLKPGTKLEGDYVLRRVSKSSILPKSKVITIGG